MKCKVENKLQQGHCHSCGSDYINIKIGSKHIYGLCPKCGRRDEIGIVFYR